MKENERQSDKPESERRSEIKQYGEPPLFLWINIDVQF